MSRREGRTPIFGLVPHRFRVAINGGAARRATARIWIQNDGGERGIRTGFKPQVKSAIYGFRKQFGPRGSPENPLAVTGAVTGNPSLQRDATDSLPVESASGEQHAQARPDPPCHPMIRASHGLQSDECGLQLIACRGVLSLLGQTLAITTLGFRVAPPGPRIVRRAQRQGVACDSAADSGVVLRQLNSDFRDKRSRELLGVLRCQPCQCRDGSVDVTAAVRLIACGGFTKRIFHARGGGF
jgi:hypothetical protein